MNGSPINGTSGLQFGKRELLPPCQAACPISQDVRSYVALISQGQFNQALKIIGETNPLPLICGLVCVHDCESECRRNQVDQPISIKALKRAAADYGVDADSIRIMGKHAEKVAIIGSGPAGLSAAFYLTTLGYQATVFEANLQPGGVMRNGIQAFRLPRSILDAEINRIRNIGVRIETSTRIDSPSELLNKGFKAVLIASGASSSLKLGVRGEDAEGVIYAIDFLENVSSSEKINLGNHVFVIGGGSVAVEAGRVALRTGVKDVHLLCLETRDMTCKDKMLAQESEIKEAEEEGLVIHPCLGIDEIITRKGRVSGLKTKICTSVRDVQGRFSPQFGECRVEILKADTVIAAIGQKAETAAFPGVHRNHNGTIKVDETTGATNIEGVFASGDVATGPASIVKAIAAGQKASLSIDAYLRGRHLSIIRESTIVEKIPQRTVDQVKKLKRKEVPTLPAMDRRDSFDLVELGYNRQDAMREAGRCLCCGAGARITSTDKCASCLTCVRCCPYGAAVNTNGDVQIDLAKCIGCGICATECPARAIELDIFGLDSIEQTIEATLSGFINDKPVALGMFCSFGALASLEEMGTYPGFRWIRIPCLSKVATRHLLKAFEMGASGVIIIGCTDTDCRYQDAVDWAELKIAEAREVLDNVGLDSERLQLHKLAHTEARELDSLVTGFLEEINKNLIGMVERGSK